MGVTGSDINCKKDFAGTIMIQPVKGLRVGGGTYFGQATYMMVNETSANDHVRNRFVVSGEYKTDRLSARTEWIKANDGGINREGLYGLAAYYLVPKKLQAVGRVDYYNRNTDAPSEVIDYTLGLNYYIYNQCRIQLNYIHAGYRSNWNQDNSNTFFAQLQIGF
jgi:hypothetical protein